MKEIQIKEEKTKDQQKEKKNTQNELDCERLKTWTTSILDWADPHPPTPKKNNNKF